MPNMMIELNTERLIIRQATGRDCSELLELYVRNREFWRQWEPAREVLSGTPTDPGRQRN
jgi:hypothetical protein